MRAGYLIIGILLGVWKTTLVANAVIDIVDYQYASELTARTLTGYYEGWARGRMYADAQWLYYVTQCTKELNRANAKK